MIVRQTSRELLAIETLRKSPRPGLPVLRTGVEKLCVEFLLYECYKE